MAYPLLAELNSIALPPQFSYLPYIPRKRVSTVATANAVVVQSAATVIVHGDGTLAWECPSCTPAEFKTIYDIFNESSLTAITFEGYWGESLSVYFTHFDNPKVRSRLFDLSGQFQVIGFTSQYNPTCN